MAPGGGGKRKRGDRTYSHDSVDGQRPSPHRPGNLSMAQQSHQYQQPLQNHGFPRDQQEQRGRGGRRGGRGGQCNGSLRSPMDSPNTIPIPPRQSNSNSNAMSPPPAPEQRPAESPGSSAQQLPMPMNNNSTQTQVSSLRPAPSFYLYEVLTDDLLKSWESGGRASLVELGQQACDDQDTFTLGTIFQEIIRSGLDGRISPSDAGTVVKGILERHPRQTESGEPLTAFPGASVFLNCISILTDSDFKHPSIAPMVLSTDISPQLMREELEIPLLEELGLIRNTFVRMGIRRQTNLLYRQSNYNLLREETEGYSKLITELFTTSNNEPPSAEVVEETFERVKAMIGTFDLDVGRVLDVTLDVFAAVLVKQYRFFVKYLRVSSWWPQQHLPPDASRSSLTSSGLPSWALPDNSGLSAPGEKEKAEINEFRTNRDKDFWNRVREIGMKAFFELGGRKIEGSAIGTSSVSDDGEDNNQVNEDRVWVESTGTLPPSGNKTAAQILGFKLRFYSSPARDPNDVLPVNLIYLAALLIKIGFISLRDLYPHLYPADGDMEKVKEEKMKEKLEREKKNRPGGAMNALMTAGALVDDTIPSGGRHREPEVNRGAASKVDSVPEKVAIPAIVEPKVEEKEELPEPADQKVQLLKSLLCIGAIPESLYILGRFPWLVDAFPDLPEYIHRILHHSLSKVYEPLRPLRDRPELREQHKVVDSDQSGVLKGQLRQIDQPPRKVLRWAQLDKDDTNEGTDYRFYWDDWCDNVPLCQSVDDVFSLCGTLLNYSGVKIGQDPALLVKLARIGNHSLAEDSSEQNKLRWIDISKRLLVPALSLTKSNAGVVNEVFELIKQFSTTTRYNIYAEWYSGSTSRLPDIKSAFDQVRAETKDVLKRISKTNVKPMARALAKVATASPGVVFQVAISQIESYDNLVEVVVECARYFTYLGYDVLTWSLMSALGTRGRNRVQADGMLTSKWLSALSLFAGKVFKRYSVMTPTPILQYVTEQLRQGNSTDLIVLEEITTSMAGIVSDTSFNETQVLGMAGGEVLQSQTMLQLLDRRHESTTTAKRLMKSLVEPRLAGQLLISIAQERQTCVYKIPEEDAHLKLLGNLFDEIHRVLTQYLDLLRSRLAVKDFDALVPNVSELIGEFGIDPPVAFWICRPSINAEMKHYDNVEAEIAAEKKKASKPPSQSIEQPEVSAVKDGTDGNEPKPPSSQGGDNNTTVEGELPETDTVMKDSSQVDGDTRVPSSEAEEEVKLPWHQILQKLMEQIGPKVPPPTWEVLSVSFYITFWQMSLNDLIVPVNNYQDEISRLQRKIASINADRSDISVAGTQKKEREKKAINDLQDQLQSERRDRMQHNIITRKRLQKEQDFWFAECWGKWEPLNIALLEHCFLPRILLSPLDSMYAFTMLKFLHGNGTKNFRTMGLLDQLFNGKRLTSLFFLCTSKEVENFGRFLNEVLKELSKWHADKAVFEKEAYGMKRGLPGFCKKMTEDMTILSFWDYEDFRRVLQKWHMNLNTALKSCFISGEYMHIRNAIVVLKAVYLHFPVINWMGQAQVASVTELSKTESREDLKIAATSLLGNLKRRAKDWVLPQAFSLNKATSNVANGTRATSAKPTTPQPESEGNKTLNALAPEFKPSPQTNVNDTSRAFPIGSGRPEAEDGEDGEINDSNVTTTAPNEKEMLAVVETVGKGATTSNKPVQQVTISEKSDSTQKIEPELPSKPVQEEKVEENEDVTMANSNLDGASQNLNGSTVSEQLPNLPRPVKPETKWTGPAHGLPSRPEALPAPQRVGEQRITDRKNDHASWELRDSRYGELGRMDRPNEPTRNRFDERHSSAPYPRGYDRPSERGPYNERDRLDPNWGGEKGRPPTIDRHIGPPNRDLRPSNRDERSERASRDRPYPESVESTRNGDPQGRHSRDHSMGPPRSSVPQHSDRAAPGHGQLEADRDQTQSDRRNDSSRYEGISTSQRGSRTSSPSRRDEHRASRHDHHPRDDIPAMDGRKPIEDFPATHSSRYEDSRPPTGPRTDRFLDGPTNGHSERFRETLARGPPQSTQPQDPNHGRLNQPASGAVRQDPQYGRLNVEVPSGPRMSNGAHGLSTRGGERHVNSTQAPTSSQISPTSQNTMSYPSAPDRQAPTGPSWTRGSSRNSASITRPAAPNSAPQTPIAETSDVHPDRLKAIQSPSLDITVGSMRTSTQMAPSPTNSSHPGGSRGLNSGQPPSSMAPSRQGPPPTGPSSHHNTERGRGRDPDKRIIQNFTNVLQQSIGLNGQDRNSQGASIRGRGGRPNNLGNLPSPISSGPPTGSLMQRQDHPPLRQEAFPPARADLFANRSVSGPSTPHRADDDAGHGRASWRDGPGREGPGRDLQQRDNIGRDGPERRSTRHRSSRSHSRDRHPPPSNLPPLPPQPAGRDAERLPRRVDEMQRDQREHRGKGGPGTGLPPLENLGREGRRGGRDGDGGPRDRDRRQDIDRRELDQWDGGRGGGIDERERDRRDSGRKRRLEDVLPSEFSGGGDGGKRSRRGI